jgi:hypothetical protein
VVAAIVALFNYWWLLLPVVTFSGFYWLYHDLYRNEADWKRVNGWLIQNKPLVTYRRIIAGLLDRVDMQLAKSEITHGMSQPQLAFSSGLIQLTMLMAAIYPIFLVVGQWITGLPIHFGELEISSSGGFLERGVALFWLSLIIMYAVATYKKSPFRYIITLLALVILFSLFVYDFSYWAAFDSGVFPENLIYGIIALNLALMSFADAIYDEGKSGGAAILGLTAILGCWFSLSRSNDYYVTVMILFSISFLISMLLIILDFYKFTKSIGWAVWVLFVFSTVSLSIFGEIGMSPQQSATIILLSFLPLLNALSDFASIGLTRLLLRRGLSGWGPKYAVIDIIGGFLIFAILGCTAIALFHWVRPQNGTPLIDLEGLFAGLEQTPEQYWWLYLMLFSTLVPTLVHGMIGMLTLLCHYPKFLRASVVALLHQGQTYRSAGRQGTALWCGMLTLSAWLPIWAMALLLSIDQGALMQSIIAGFTVFARAIGAI